MKAKSIEDEAVINQNIPHLTVEEPEGNIHDSKITVKISIVDECWDEWEKLSIELREKFR